MIDKDTGSFHELLNDGLDLEMQMILIELKHGWKSPAYRRFEKLKQRYYNLFEEILLEKGYESSKIPYLFNNHFKQWYGLNSKGRGNPKRVDVINQFLKEFWV